MEEKRKLNLEALNTLAKPVDVSAEGKRKWLAENDFWLKEMGIIAIRILTELKSKKMSQTDLALIMGKTPQYISRVVKGQENLTFCSIKQFESALGIGLICLAPHSNRKIKTVVNYSKASYIGIETVSKSIEINMQPMKDISQVLKETLTIV